MKLNLFKKTQKKSLNKNIKEKKLSKRKMNINIESNVIKEFNKDCVSGKFYQSEILKKYNITYSPYRRILKENNITPKYKQDYRKTQDISNKSKGVLLQIHPETLKVIKEYETLEAVKRDKSNKFNPESIRVQMKIFKKSYGFYWCRKDDYKEYIKKLKSLL